VPPLLLLESSFLAPRPITLAQGVAAPQLGAPPDPAAFSSPVITSADWSLMLDMSSTTQMSGTGIGNVVQGVADINQCIAIILATPKGSDPLRPTFASDLWRWIDAPITVARPNLVREIVEAITRWEPRVRVLSVVINLVGVSQLGIAITWQLKVDVTGTGNQQLVLTVPRNLS
jgi:phage baseplate assembly protein W